MCDSFSFLLLQWSIQDETEISSVTSFIFNLISQPNSNGRDIKRKIYITDVKIALQIVTFLLFFFSTLQYNSCLSSFSTILFRDCLDTSVKNKKQNNEYSSKLSFIAGEGDGHLAGVSQEQLAF